MEADVLAEAIAGLLDAAIRHWVKARGRPPLRDVLRKAFGYLALRRPAST
ncbi:hypothetical protein NR798_10165 [Archangium gephyra]